MQIDDEGALGTAHTDEPPQDGFEIPGIPGRSTAGPWAAASCSCQSATPPFDEFVPGYYARRRERFGRGYFGCCDPLHDLIGSVRKMASSIRKVSMGSWAEVERGAEAIGPDYVFSRKPAASMAALDE